VGWRNRFRKSNIIYAQCVYCGEISLCDLQLIEVDQRDMRKAVVYEYCTHVLSKRRCSAMLLTRIYCIYSVVNEIINCFLTFVSRRPNTHTHTHTSASAYYDHIIIMSRPCKLHKIYNVSIIIHIILCVCLFYKHNINANRFAVFTAKLQKQYDAQSVIVIIIIITNHSI